MYRQMWAERMLVYAYASSLLHVFSDFPESRVAAIDFFFHPKKTLAQSLNIIFSNVE